jgi:hypothetical protein
VKGRNTLGLVGVVLSAAFTSSLPDLGGPISLPPTLSLEEVSFPVAQITSDLDVVPS